MPLQIVRLCRTPRWVRGLKSYENSLGQQAIESHPTMGAWIEIMGGYILDLIREGRTPRWVRGLK